MQFSCSSSFLQLPSASLSSVPPASSIFFQLQFLLSQLGSSSFLQLHSVQFLQLPPASLSSVQFSSVLRQQDAVQFTSSTAGCSSVQLMQFSCSTAGCVKTEKREKREGRGKSERRRTRRLGGPITVINIEEKWSRQERPPKFMFLINNINYPDVTRILAAALRCS